MSINVSELITNSLNISVEIDVYDTDNKIDQIKEPQHHCNDCHIIGDSVYVSMFSYTGNYKKDVFDGCVLEFDLTHLPDSLKSLLDQKPGC